jgi:hypothetical protein
MLVLNIDKVPLSVACLFNLKCALVELRSCFR